MKVKCFHRKPQRLPLHRDDSVQWKMTVPFVINQRGVLVHRVKSASSHPLSNGALHHSCVNWCGSGFYSGQLKFVETPPENRLLCAVCEDNAVRHGEKTADDLAGRHVHKGRLKAHRTCCQENNN